MSIPSRGQVRIIGGLWRGKKITFPSVEGLRPTSDRIRETLFNWLQQNIVNANCLDLFAGSGALSFEAYSRGARSITLVEQHPDIIKALRAAAQAIPPERFILHATKAENFLQNCQESFNIVFLDPPFQHTDITQLLQNIAQSKILTSHSLIYLETEKTAVFTLPSNWIIRKEKSAGNVKFCLIANS